MYFDSFTVSEKEYIISVVC